jgi:copper chaperone CopZ
MKRNLFLIFIVLGLSTGCFRKEVVTLVVKVPQMKSQECSRIILNALQGPIDGIITATPDLNNRTIAVTYDSTKLATKNIEFVIAGVGFDANDIPAKPEARKALPAGCRE